MYQTDRIVPPKAMDYRHIQVAYLPMTMHRHGGCHGLRTAAQPSDVRTYDAATGKLKMIQSPTGVIKWPPRLRKHQS